MVDVTTAIVIRRPVGEVAGFAADPSNAPAWYVNIQSVEWRTPPPHKVGSQMDFVASFMGRTMSYTYEITEYEPGSLLVMRTAEGPFPMETTYTWAPWDDDPANATAMTLRNRGEPRGFRKVQGLLMGPAMKRANRKDLEELKQLLERER